MSIKNLMPSARTGKWFICLLAVYLFGIANWLFPVIRTSSAFLNHAFMLLIFLLPSVLSVLSFFVTKRIIFRFLLAFALIPLALSSFLIGAISLFPLIDIMTKGYDPSFEHLRSTQLDSSRISIYRTNGGATTSFGIIVRQEKYLFPGLLLVRNIYGVYPGDDAEIIKLDDDTIKIISPPYGDKRPVTDEAIIKVKYYVYL